VTQPKRCSLTKDLAGRSVLSKNMLLDVSASLLRVGVVYRTKFPVPMFCRSLPFSLELVLGASEATTS
jgi:hypothetical protein